MAEKVEDLNLPNSVIQRIIKETIPPGVNVKKEARTAIARAASVFVLYLTSSANNLSLKSNRKTISGSDVVNALSMTDFDRFVDPLNIALAEYKQSRDLKKLTLLAGKKSIDLDSTKTREAADKTIEEDDSEATEDAADEEESEEEESANAG